MRGHVDGARHRTSHWITLHPPSDPEAWAQLRDMGARLATALDELWRVRSRRGGGGVRRRERAGA